MVWVKIPVENRPVFLAALPSHPRVSTVNMFGGIAALVNGNMFGGLFARSIMVKLGEADQALALALDGSEVFDPMGNGRVMTNAVLLSESVMEDPEEIRLWLRRAFDFTSTLPPKQHKARSAKPSKARSAKPSKARPIQPAKPKPKPKPKRPTKATSKVRRVKR